MLDWGCRMSPIKVVHSHGDKVVKLLVEAFVPLHMGLFIHRSA